MKRLDAPKKKLLQPKEEFETVKKERKVRLFGEEFCIPVGAKILAKTSTGVTYILGDGRVFSITADKIKNLARRNDKNF